MCRRKNRRKDRKPDDQHVALLVEITRPVDRARTVYG